MPYGLRSKEDRKRPQRYHPASVKNDWQYLKPGSGTIDLNKRLEYNFGTVPGIDSHQIELLLPPSLPRPLIFIINSTKPTSAPQQPAPAQIPVITIERPRSPAQIMPQIVRQTRKTKRRREDDDPTGDNETGTPARLPSAHPWQQSAGAPSTTPSIYTTLTPSAFPTRSCSPAQPKDAQTLSVERQQYARRMMEAREANDQKGIKECEQAVDCLYACTQPIENPQAEWYRQLKERWAHDNSPKKIMFESLYASLRQVIIERIRDELVPRKYHDPYHPVQVILELNHTQLAQSMADSCEVWSTIPEHLLEYRRLNPLAHVDPDTPPPRELVRAIGYLKQNHLAGNLLGEWQMPLPSAECFASFAEESSNSISISNLDNEMFAASDFETDPIATGNGQLVVGDAGSSRAPLEGLDRYDAAGCSRSRSQTRIDDTSVTTTAILPAPRRRQSISWKSGEQSVWTPMDFAPGASPTRNGSKEDYPFRKMDPSEEEGTWHSDLETRSRMIASMRHDLGDRTTLHPVAGRTARDPEIHSAWLANPKRTGLMSSSRPEYAQSSLLNTLEERENFLTRSAKAAQGKPSPSTGIPYTSLPRTQTLPVPYEIKHPSNGLIHNTSRVPYCEVDRMLTEGDDYIPPSTKLQDRENDGKIPSSRSKKGKGMVADSLTAAEHAEIKRKTTEMYRELCIPLDQRQPVEPKLKKPKKLAGKTIAPSASTSKYTSVPTENGTRGVSPAQTTVVAPPVGQNTLALVPAPPQQYPQITTPSLQQQQSSLSSTQAQPTQTLTNQHTTPGTPYPTATTAATQTLQPAMPRPSTYATALAPTTSPQSSPQLPESTAVPMVKPPPNLPRMLTPTIPLTPPSKLPPLPTPLVQNAGTATTTPVVLSLPVG
ncbi:predicted protein [Plenodomus lingam JN3]|uniref:Uncharacterized protein n=1 Tax=Leptosphaeria maculans (strain JN3 / isolate v23.1.3 / race Av1-4-5-6-7-8) TaxID=985895 RepID=E5A680_LEPMJ|nr:predicted protein [Plenodomus lingam JN3]CBX99125.1 predicted protein [Plenodomus lingam JN3]